MRFRVYVLNWRLRGPKVFWCFWWGSSVHGGRAACGLSAHCMRLGSLDLNVVTLPHVYSVLVML